MARPPLIAIDDAFFAGVDPPPVLLPELPADPPPFHDLDFGMDETTVIGPPSARTARGWAYRADKVLAPRGKTLRDDAGRMLFSRAEFLRVPARVLHTLVAYELQVDPGRIPWGAFRDEVETFDQEADWERLRSWLEER